MKKIITLILAVAVITVMSIVPSFANYVNMSRDQVTIHDPTTPAHKANCPSDPGDHPGFDLGKHGQNDPLTDLGDISDQKLGLIVVYGWVISTEKIDSFGYRINDGEAVKGIAKFYNPDPERQADNEAVAGMAAGSGYPDGESVRFRYEIPVQVGEDIEISLFFTDATGDDIDMDWKIVYTNTYQPTAEESTPCEEAMPQGSTGGSTGGETTPGGNTGDDNNPGSNDNDTPDTGDSMSVVMLIASAVVCAAVLLKKRECR